MTLNKCVVLAGLLAAAMLVAIVALSGCVLRGGAAHYRLPTGGEVGVQVDDAAVLPQLCGQAADKDETDQAPAGPAEAPDPEPPQ